MLVPLYPSIPIQVAIWTLKLLLSFAVITRFQSITLLLTLPEKINYIGSNLFFSGGMYDPLLRSFSRLVQYSRLVFSLGGHGAEVYKGNYGWRSIAMLSSSIKKDSFAVQAIKGLASIGVDCDVPCGSEYHYLAYRNPLHSSRGSILSLGMRPLLQKSLVSLSYSCANRHPRPAKNRPNIVTDMLLSMGQEFVATQFDKIDKMPSSVYVADFLSSATKPLQTECVEP